MAWQGVYGVDEIAVQFARANGRGRLGGSFLFVGPQGVGKRVFAFALAKTLLCRRRFRKEGDRIVCDVGLDPSASPEELLERFQPCGECESCKEFQFDPMAPDAVLPTHPDFHYVCKPADKTMLPLELLVGAKEERMQSGLCSELSRTSSLGGYRVAVIDDADYFNVEGANALLKTLEEPPKNTIIILIGTSATKQLPTIRSRCQIFRFQPLPDEAVADILLTQEKVGSPEEAEAVVRNAGGSMTEAYRSLNSDLSVFQHTLLTALSDRHIAAVDLAGQVCEYVDKVSKEAQVRRRRLQNVLKSAASFYRALYRELDAKSPRGFGEPGAAALAPFVRRAIQNSNPTVEFALDCLERSLDAIDQIDRNANLPFIVEAWLYDLAANARALDPGIRLNARRDL